MLLHCVGKEGELVESVLGYSGHVRGEAVGERPEELFVGREFQGDNEGGKEVEGVLIGRGCGQR